MKRILLIVVVVAVSLSLASLSDAKRKRRRRLNDKGVPIVEKYVCSNLCRGDESIYIYDGVTDPEQCENIGGEMYSDEAWGSTLVVCKVMHKKRCRQQDGKLGEFHTTFKPSHYKHLGCTAGMEPEECRQILREAYAGKPASNKFFMNNVGCRAH
jgi:hypothetical protein